VDGVLVLLKAAFRQRLQPFNACLEQYRAAEGKRLLNTGAYEQLPNTSTGRGDFEWRLRRYDLAVIHHLLRHRPRQQILDVGAWNGWLSHRLAAQGHTVTAIDYFTDRFDGLGARTFYSTEWQAIQMDLTDLSPLDQTFDVIVLNRCLQFFSDPVQYVAQVSGKVAPKGLLIVTGLAFYQDPTVKAYQVQALQESYQRQFGSDIFLHPTKGYLSFADRSRLAVWGLRLHPYGQLLLANLKSLFWPMRPRYYYGVYTVNAGI
jgi:2-polyprenyl-3-methyl-5-hydroxy-6-metoxy-1,4-benzoquinol methylase